VDWPRGQRLLERREGGSEAGLALAKLPSWQQSSHSKGTATYARTNVMTALSAFPLHGRRGLFFSSSTRARPWTMDTLDTLDTTFLRNLGGAFHPSRVSPPPLARRCEIRRVSGGTR